jgi:nucleoside permease NupC
MLPQHENFPSKTNVMYFLIVLFVIIFFSALITIKLPFLTAISRLKRWGAPSMRFDPEKARQ